MNELNANVSFYKQRNKGLAGKFLFSFCMWFASVFVRDITVVVQFYILIGLL